jgi:hypothetical protein
MTAVADDPALAQRLGRCAAQIQKETDEAVSLRNGGVTLKPSPIDIHLPLLM